MQFGQLRRREFITLLGGTAAWPLAARAQQGERVRRIGVLINFAQTDREGQASVAAFTATLQEVSKADQSMSKPGVSLLGDQLGGCTEIAQAASGMEAARSSIWLLYGT